MPRQGRRGAYGGDQLGRGARAEPLDRRCPAVVHILGMLSILGFTGLVRRYAVNPSPLTLAAAAAAAIREVPGPRVTAYQLHELWRTAISGAIGAKLFDRRHPEAALLALLRQKIHELQGRPPVPKGPAWQTGRFTGTPALVLTDASLRDQIAGLAVWIPSKKVRVMLRTTAASPTEAEVLSATQAIRTACAVGIRQIHLLTDCAYIPLALCRPALPGLLAQLTRAALEAEAVLIEKVPRPFLHKADRLAFSALCLPEDTSAEAIG